MTTLSLNGFFIIDGDEGLESLLQFIAKSDTLQSVSIAGTELKTLGITTLDIIDTLYINRSIKRIDMPLLLLILKKRKKTNSAPLEEEAAEKNPDEFLDDLSEKVKPKKKSKKSRKKIQQMTQMMMKKN